MKRDLELVRKIVLTMEDSPGGYSPEMKIEGYSDEEVGYHCYLIVDAGLATGVNMTAYSERSPNWLVTCLTWAGHEFAEASRDEGRWKQAWGIVKEKGGSVTIAVLSELLTALMKKALMP